jgi:hypothetical protein
MPATWTSDFDFFRARMGEDPLSVTIDLAALPHTPVATHPVRLNVRVAMRHKRPDGLRSSEEMDALLTLEEQVEAALVKAADAISVARLVYGGYTDWLFYVPAERRAAAEDPKAAAGDVSPYELEWETGEDPGWIAYRNLYPDRYDIQTIWNRRQVSVMKEGGDRIDLPREIDHTATFPTEKRARQAAKALAGRGFRVGEPRRHEGRWWLSFHRSDRCDGRRPDEFTFEILDVVLPLDGEFDGWGSMAPKPPG